MLFRIHLPKRFELGHESWIHVRECDFRFGLGFMLIMLCIRPNLAHSLFEMAKAQSTPQSPLRFLTSYILCISTLHPGLCRTLSHVLQPFPP